LKNAKKEEKLLFPNVPYTDYLITVHTILFKQVFNERTLLNYHHDTTFKALQTLGPLRVGVAKPKN